LPPNLTPQGCEAHSTSHDLAVTVANLDHRIVVDKPKPDPKGACQQQER
jgi:hypothetical protein